MNGLTTAQIETSMNAPQAKVTCGPVIPVGSRPRPREAVAERRSGSDHRSNNSREIAEKFWRAQERSEMRMVEASAASNHSRPAVAQGGNLR